MSDTDITFFGKTNFRNEGNVFGIRRSDRRQHTYVIGKTGVGKTALLKNMALQDIERGEGLAIIDPHGEFVEEVLDKIPASRANDVIYFNPADLDYPISFNILEVPDVKYKHLVASGLIGVFTKIWANVWSARMEYILSNCILALLDTPNTTLLSILRMLVDKDYRQKILNNVQDPVVKSFWINEYEEWQPNFRNEAISPIQNKVGQFLNVSLIRNIVGQSKSTINIPEIMDSKKILLVNVSKGRVGEDNAALLGSMIITKIQLATMERVRIPEDQRTDFYLYVDEFQNFVTESFANILSEARKYRLNLVLAHQYVGQLISQDNTKVRDAVFGNVGTLVAFRVGAGDAEFLENQFTPEFTIEDLVNLPNYNIYLRLMINGVSSRPFSAQTLPPITSSDKKSNRDLIIKLSRERYAKPRERVEEAISNWSGVMEEAQAQAPRAPVMPTLYDVKCSLCGKWTKVTFKPDGVRPVHCKPCLKKMEKERMDARESKEKEDGPAPVITNQRPIISSRPQEPGQFSQLGDLGIEFESTPAINYQPPRNNQPVAKKFPQTLSISEALEKEPISFTKKKKEVDLTALRQAIKETGNPLDKKENS
jgi:CxxC-x17-CxxC domain-containing protein